MSNLRKGCLKAASAGAGSCGCGCDAAGGLHCIWRGSRCRSPRRATLFSSSSTPLPPSITLSPSTAPPFPSPFLLPMTSLSFLFLLPFPPLPAIKYINKNREKNITEETTREMKSEMGYRCLPHRANKDYCMKFFYRLLGIQSPIHVCYYSTMTLTLTETSRENEE